MAVTNFIWDELSDNVLLETDDSGNVTAEYNNLPGEFGEPVSRRVGFAESFLHYDGLGSTRQLTNQAQVVSDTYTYSAFGETVASSGSTTNPLQFNGSVGYYKDEETGDFYVRRRTYDPGIARWLSRDPLGFVDGPNVYAAVNNQPIGLSDPSGLISCPLKECCCVENLRISPPLEDNGVSARIAYSDDLLTFWGHDFDVVADLKLRYGITGGKCKLEWWELASDDTHGNDQYQPWGGVAGEWYEAHKQIYGGGTPSKDWPDYETETKTYDANGCLSLTQNDRPIVPFNHSRNLKFLVIVYSTPNCPCINKKLTLEFKQVLVGKGVYRGGEPRPRNPSEIPRQFWDKWELSIGIDCYPPGKEPGF